MTIKYKSRTNLNVFKTHTVKNQKLKHNLDYQYVDDFIYKVDTNVSIHEVISNYKSFSYTLTNPRMALMYFINKKEVYDFFFELHERTNLYIFNLDIVHFTVDKNGFLIIYIRVELCKNKKETVNNIPENFFKINRSNKVILQLSAALGNKQYENYLNLLEKMILDLTNNNKEDELYSMAKRKKELINHLGIYYGRDEKGNHYASSDYEYEYEDMDDMEYFEDFREVSYKSNNTHGLFTMKKNKDVKSKNENENKNKDFFAEIVKRTEISNVLDNLISINLEEKLILKDYLNSKKKENLLKEYFFKEGRHLKCSESLIREFDSKSYKVSLKAKNKSVWSFKWLFKRKETEEDYLDTIYDSMYVKIMNWQITLFDFFKNKFNVNQSELIELESTMNKLIENMVMMLKKRLDVFTISFVLYLDDIFDTIFKELEKLNNVNAFEYKIIEKINLKVIEKELFINNVLEEINSIFFEKEEEKKEFILKDFEKRIEDL